MKRRPFLVSTRSWSAAPALLAQAPRLRRVAIATQTAREVPSEGMKAFVRR